MAKIEQKNRYVSIRMPNTLYAQVERDAVQSERSAAATIRKILTEFYKKNEKTETDRTHRQPR